jgi:hypothetical protein
MNMISKKLGSPGLGKTFTVIDHMLRGVLFSHSAYNGSIYNSQTLVFIALSIVSAYLGLGLSWLAELHLVGVLSKALAVGRILDSLSRC